jgi:hypothetical protein
MDGRHDQASFICADVGDGLVDAQDESERLENFLAPALRHIVNLEGGFTGPTPEREALVARTFIGVLWRNSCKHKDSPAAGFCVAHRQHPYHLPLRVRVHAPSCFRSRRFQEPNNQSLEGVP